MAAFESTARAEPVVSEFGVGPTYFGAAGANHERVRQLGAAFHFDAHNPVAEHFGVGVGFTWGFTDWERVPRVARVGYKLAGITTRTLGYVWDKALHPDRGDEEVAIVLADIALTYVAVFAYLTAALFYVVSPLAATTYGETNFTANWRFLSDPRNGPTLKLGAGAVGYIHPVDEHAYAGIGPHAAIGWRFGKVGLAFMSTVVPASWHGGQRHDTIITTGLTVNAVH
jgi:hypothetical protein